jgi:N-acetylneuraminic acid mutarotase
MNKITPGVPGPCFRKITKLLLLACLLLPSASCGQSVIEISSPKFVIPDFYRGFYDVSKWEIKAPMPRAREDFAFVALNNKLYAIGGDLSNVWLADNDAYDIATNKWEQKAPMAKNRSGIAAVTTGGKIYAIGGFDGATKEWREFLEVYDPVADKWEQKSSMLTKRGGLGAGVIDNKIYAVGGNISEAEWLDKLEVYNPADNTWQFLDPMPTARTQVAVGAANSKLYVFGGINSKGVLDTVEEYDPRRKKWRARASLAVPRTNAEVAVVDNNIFVMGGKDVDNKIINSVEVYNVNTNRWSQGKPLSVAKEGFGSQITADGSTLYISGGLGTGILNTLEAGTVVKK